MPDSLDKLIGQLYEARTTDWEAAKLQLRNWLKRRCSDALGDGDSARLVIHEGRIKDPARALDKLRRKIADDEIEAPSSFEHVEEAIPDLVGVKVLAKSTRDQTLLWERLRDVPPDGPDSIPRLDRDKNYIERPKRSGYRAVHATYEVPIAGGRDVLVELQIKTRLQDAWSELTHEDLYKPGAAMNPSTFHSSVARTMANLLAEVDRLADDLATELAASVEGGLSDDDAPSTTTAPSAQDRSEPETSQPITVRVRATGPRYALAVDDDGRQGLIPARRVRELASAGGGLIDVNDHVLVGDELTVEVSDTESGLFYLPVKLAR
jgi:putative GTP pyrophosphokinase